MTVTPQKGADCDANLTDEICAAAVTSGIVAFGRYSKNLTVAEVALCTKYNLGLWLISEPGDGGWDRISQGAPEGGRDAATAIAQAKAVGFPTGLPIFAAFDFSAAEANIKASQSYMDGQGGYADIMHTAGYKSAMYADGLIQTSVATDCGGYVPGASAWAGSAAYLTSGRATLVQHPTITFAETEIDPVDIYDTSVIWFPAPPQAAVQPQPPAAAPPAAAPAAPVPVAPVAAPPQPNAPVSPAIHAAPLPVPVAPIPASRVSAAPAVAPAIPSPLEIQTMLKAAGVYTGALDGIWGPQSSAAQSRYYLNMELSALARPHVPEVPKAPPVER
jgi:hypothetical protein